MIITPEQQLETPETDPALRSFKGELLLLIAEQARRVPLSLVLTTSIMAALVSAYVPLAYTGGWLVLVYLGTLIHTRVILGLPGDTRRSEEARLTIAAWSFTLHGTLLAALIAAFFFVPITMGAVISIYNVALCAATVHATAGYRRIYLPYAIVTLGPVAIMWAFAPHVSASAFQRGSFVALVLALLVTMLGHAKGTFAMFTDAYNMRLQRLQLNRQLREALVKAEQANRAKTRFLAAASHDLRQPIHALSLFSGSLSLRPLDARTAPIAEQIDKAVQALASQLDALLDVSRLDAGVVEKSIAVVDLHGLFGQLSGEFAPQAERKRLGFSLRVPPGMRVRTDPMLFERILRNLLSNAIKYTDAGHIELSAEGRGAGCEVAVRDTGLGIPEGEQARVFEEFYQLHNPERDRSKGLGLGLAIVRRLAALLEIEVRVESTPGGGSRFSLELPLVQGELPVAVTATDAPLRAASGWPVLVLDDEEAIRLGMQTLLAGMGFAVRVAASSAEALALARAQPPAIVLADFRLQGADNGLQAIAALRALLPGLPALLISGDTAPDRLREAHAAGVLLLHKPVNAAVLRQAILDAVAG